MFAALLKDPRKRCFAGHKAAKQSGVYASFSNAPPHLRGVDQYPTHAVFSSLQACRPLAAIAVVVFHALAFYLRQRDLQRQTLSPIFDMGYAGSDASFVLSGFIGYIVHRQDIGTPAAGRRILVKPRPAHFSYKFVGLGRSCRANGAGRRRGIGAWPVSPVAFS